MKILDDGIELDAIQTMPEGYREGEKYPLLIIIHGFTGNKEESHLQAVGDAARKAGFATLAVDMYGHGKSSGTFFNHTLYKWITNTITIVDYARTLDFVSDIWLCGHSQGGCTVMLTAPMLHDRIRGILPLSPAWQIPEDARRGVILDVPFDPVHIPEEIDLWDGYVLGSNYIRVAMTLDVETAIDRYNGPVYIVHGEADASVPVKRAYLAHERYKNAELTVIPGDTHCFDNHADQLHDAIYHWLRKQYA